MGYIEDALDSENTTGNTTQTYWIFSRHDLFTEPSSLTCLAEELHVAISEMRAMVGEEAKNGGMRRSGERVLAGVEHCVVLGCVERELSPTADERVGIGYL